MSTEIVTWGVVENGVVDTTWHSEAQAKAQAKMYGGTVVRLSGKMPRVARKREFIGFGDMEHLLDSEFEGVYFSATKQKNWPNKVKVTIEEILEGEQ